MKRIVALVVACILTCGQLHAVLKEKDLARTLGVLRAELAADYEKQQQFMAMYEQQGAQQQQQLKKYMTRCEQIALMLYSQSTQNTFDMAYACQQATSLYRELHVKEGRMLDYNKIIVSMKREIDRYDNLIRTLKNMQPKITDDTEGETTAEDSLTIENDSVILEAIDSLQEKKDSLSGVKSSTPLPPMPPMEPKEEEESNDPLVLSGQLLEDRAACLKYATALRNNMSAFLTALERYSEVYTSLREKVKRLNEFALSRYKVLQDNIFRSAGDNYLKVLASLPRRLHMAKESLKSKYRPFKQHDGLYSQWRGTNVVFVTCFLFLYLSLGLGISYIVLRWLLPKKWRSKELKMKRLMLSNIVGIALFAIFTMIVRSTTESNFTRMGMGLIINIAWLFEVIFLSLYIRLKSEQMRHAATIYTPLMIMAFVDILFRIILVPNMVVSLVYPPIMLAMTIWQVRVATKHATELPALDKAYTGLTSLIMVVACLLAWIGYSLFAVQVMIWWTFQLAAIMTITCVYDLMEMYETRFLVFRIHPELKEKQKAGKDISKSLRTVLEEMKQGKHFGKTWFYDLVNRTLVPIFAVASVLFSLYWAGATFEMTNLFIRAFTVNFIDQKDLIQVSLEKLCLVAALWFIFRYLNYGIRSLFRSYRKMTLKAGEQYNGTLARNIIAIVCWGIYFIVALVILHVPRTGISIVSAGLATGVGFAMQSILENFFYGISLMTGRLRVGDYIECDGMAGKVESISYQSTQIVTADGCVISFLNSALFSKNFKNMTRNHRYELIKIPVGVAYGSDVEQVRSLISEAIAPICQGKNKEGKLLTRHDTPPTILFSDFGDSSVDLKVCIWMLVEEKIELTGRIKEVIYETLNKNNIEIPFPQRDVHIIQS